MTDNNSFLGLPPNLVPHPPSDMPEAPGIGDAMAAQSPFTEPQDINQIIANLTLDRPLKLFVPNKERYRDWEFRVINSIPTEIANAHNKGFREVTEPELVALFADLVAGTTKDGKAFRPILMSRPKAVGDHVRKRYRQELQSLYAGMDPTNKELDGKYTENVKTGQDASKAKFSGDFMRIRVK